MNIHFFLRHKYLTLFIIFLIGGFGGCIISGILLASLSKNMPVVSALGTWAFGIITMTLGLLYFLLDRNQDINILFSPVVRNGETKFCLQAFNTGKLGTIASFERIYISYKEPVYSTISNDYKSGDSDKMCFINIKELNSVQDLQKSNYQQYYSLPGNAFSPELLIEEHDLVNSIVRYTNHSYYDKQRKQTPKFEKCYLSIICVDINNDPSIYDFSLSEKYIKLINDQLLSFT